MSLLEGCDSTCCSAGPPVWQTHQKQTTQIESSLHNLSVLTRDDGVVLDGASHDHDGVVQGALRLLDELFGAASQYHRARLRLRAASEEIVPEMNKYTVTQR